MSPCHPVWSILLNGCMPGKAAACAGPGASRTGWHRMMRKPDRGHIFRSRADARLHEPHDARALHAVISRASLHATEPSVAPGFPGNPRSVAVPQTSGAP